MKYLAVLFSLLWIPMLHGQNYSLKAEIQGLSNQEVYLADFYGDKNNILDTAMPDASGTFRFEIKDTYFPGMYRLFSGQDVLFDLIISTTEDIRLKSSMGNLYEGMEVIESEENNVYYGFLKTGNKSQRKFDLLSPPVLYYPKEDPFYALIREEYVNSQKAYIAYVDSLISSYPDLWATRILRQRKPLYYGPELNEIQRRDYSIQHFFDHVDFSDVELIRSNVFTTLSIEYMSLYSNPNFTQDQLQEEFILAVDQLMYEAMDNGLVYEFIVEYLTGGFEKYHFDKVLDYIAENYTPEQCENETRKSDLETRLAKYAELAVGKKAPDITTLDENGAEVKLYSLDSEYTLVIFWASWCPHCNESLPEIDNIYRSSINTRTVQILAYSLDQVREEWMDALATGNYSWMNVSDLKGWESQAAIDYNIYATPTMFLLDKDKNILAKPITVDELKEAFFKENILK